MLSILSLSVLPTPLDPPAKASQINCQKGGGGGRKEVEGVGGRGGGAFPRDASLDFIRNPETKKR